MAQDLGLNVWKGFIRRLRSILGSARGDCPAVGIEPFRSNPRPACPGREGLFLGRGRARRIVAFPEGKAGVKIRRCCRIRAILVLF